MKPLWIQALEARQAEKEPPKSKPRRKSIARSIALTPKALETETVHQFDRMAPSTSDYGSAKFREDDEARCAEWTEVLG